MIHINTEVGTDLGVYVFIGKRAIWMENDQSRTEQHSEDESEDY